MAILEPGFAWIDMETVAGDWRRRLAGKLDAAAVGGGGAVAAFDFPRFEGAISFRELSAFPFCMCRVFSYWSLKS